LTYVHNKIWIEVIFT